MFATVPTVGPQADIFSMSRSASINDPKTSPVDIANFHEFHLSVLPALVHILLI
ncbi:hypothetical protein SAMN05216332_101485 [Nitrosospira briensis]|nr:hypothetical protein SAMN05216332_101485 [Nitrosospira briensis]